MIAFLLDGPLVRSRQRCERFTPTEFQNAVLPNSVQDQFVSSLMLFKNIKLNEKYISILSRVPGGAVFKMLDSSKKVLGLFSVPGFSLQNLHAMSNFH